MVSSLESQEVNALDWRWDRGSGADASVFGSLKLFRCRVKHMGKRSVLRSRWSRGCSLQERDAGDCRRMQWSSVGGLEEGRRASNRHGIDMVLTAMRVENACVR